MYFTPEKIETYNMDFDYDQWLVDQEHNFRGWNDSPKGEQCGKKIEKEGFCSSFCHTASMM